MIAERRELLADTADAWMTFTARRHKLPDPVSLKEQAAESLFACHDPACRRLGSMPGDEGDDMTLIVKH